MKIGFIGLGKMGSAIAINILNAGHEVTVWNRSPEPVRELEGKGAVAARSPEETLQGDALFSMLASDSVMRSVGLDGALLDKAAKGLIHANMATISTAFARELTAVHEKRGLHYVSAPVFGRPDAAEAAKLIVVAAGAAQAIEKLSPVFDKIGVRTVKAGTAPEKANLFKIAGNFMIIAALETMGEAFALLRKGGVDPKLFHDVMSNSLFADRVHTGYGSLILNEAFDPAGFEMVLGLKDADLARGAGKELEVPMPLADLAAGHFRHGIENGMAKMDWSAIAQVIAEKAGL